MSLEDVARVHRENAKMVTATRVEPLGALAQTYLEAIRLADKMRAEGASASACIGAVTTALRAAWPKDREEPWHYLCTRCEDTGWVAKTCGQRSCGRPFTLPKHAGDDRTGKATCRDGHSYVEPCWCQKGQAFKRQLLKTPRAPEDAVAAAARTSQPTRVGR